MARLSRNHRLDVPQLELECLRALWEGGPATGHEIRRGLLRTRTLAYTTVMTLVGRLTHKGLVDREKQGRAFRYRALVPQNTIRERALDRLVANFFGSRDALRRYLETGVIDSGSGVTESLGSTLKPGAATPPDDRIDPALL